MKKIPQKQINHWVGRLGYEIIDEIIAPECGIGSVVADLYLADIGTYTSGDKQSQKIINKIYRKYKIPKMSVLLTDHTPIALLALAILEEGTYK